MILLFPNEITLEKPDLGMDELSRIEGRTVGFVSDLRQFLRSIRHFSFGCLYGRTRVIASCDASTAD